MKHKNYGRNLKNMDEEEFFSEEEDFEDEPADEESLLIQQEISECFLVFDHKNKGKMASKFLEKALRSIGIHLTSFELEEVLEKYDKDGSIELTDFQVFATEKLREIEAARSLKQAFEVFDPDKEGVIPGDRFKKWLTTLGDPLTDGEAKELYKMGDPSNKGWFAYDDVIPMLIY